MITYHITANGFDSVIRYTDAEIAVLDRLLDKLVFIRENEKRDVRTIAFVSGPPGAGKSTLSLSLEKRAGDRKLPFSVQCLGLDGFHKRADELRGTKLIHNGRNISLSEIKGAPETFEEKSFVERLIRAKYEKAVSWPVYDRRIHDVSDKEIQVTGEILIVEGNWLMLSGGWSEGQKASDLTVSVFAGERVLKERLIARKILGGKTRDEAVKWYELVDGPNVRRYHDQSGESMISVVEDENGIRIEKDKSV